MKKGFSDAMFVPKWDTEKFLKLTSKAGFDGVELNFREEGGDLTDHTTLRDAEKLGKLVRDNDLETAAISTTLHNIYAISSSNSKLRDRGIDIASKMIDFAGAMGAPVVQVVPGVLFEETPYHIGYELAQEALSRLGDQAAAAGVIVGLENVCNNFLSNPLEFKRFIDEINHPAVQFYLDNGNALKTGIPEHYIALMGEQTCCVHFKDYRIKCDDYVPLLEGDINWPSNLQALKDVSYDGYVITTPAYPHKYCQERLVEKSSQDLSAVLSLLKPIQNNA